MEKEWAVVLAGGGAKGAYQIGVWRALEECGYFQRIGAFFGDSIGAINACLMAGTSFEEAKEAWNNLDFFTVFQPDIEMLDGKEGVFSREELLKLFDEHLDFQKIAESKVYVNATKLEKNGEKKAVYFRLKGETPERIKKILLASSALPVLYESVEIDGAEYRDGGLTDNLPVMPAYVAGYRKIIVVLLAKDTVFDASAYPDCEMLIIRPSHDLGNLLDGTLNFTESKIRFLMEFGYFDAMAMIAEHNRSPKESGKKREELVEEELRKLQMLIKAEGEGIQEDSAETEKSEESFKKVEKQEKGSAEEENIGESFKEVESPEKDSPGRENFGESFKEVENLEEDSMETEKPEENALKVEALERELQENEAADDAAIADIEKRLAEIELQIAAERAEKMMEEMAQKITAEESSFYTNENATYQEESAAYRMALYEFRKEELQRKTQSEFDKIHSYMDRYGIEK